MRKHQLLDEIGYYFRTHSYKACDRLLKDIRNLHSRIVLFKIVADHQDEQEARKKRSE